MATKQQTKSPSKDTSRPKPARSRAPARRDVSPKKRRVGSGQAARKGGARAAGLKQLGQRDTTSIHQAAQRGVSGGGSKLPFHDRIQQSFGAHDLSGVTAHVGGRAAKASDEIGAVAYATGDKLAFRQAPSLRTAAHEAAHVIQQRRGVQLEGGVGKSGDSYEQHADKVADMVVRGQNVEALLGAIARPGRSAVQRMAVQREDNEEAKKAAPDASAEEPKKKAAEDALECVAPEDFQDLGLDEDANQAVLKAWHDMKGQGYDPTEFCTDGKGRIHVSGEKDSIYPDGFDGQDVMNEQKGPIVPYKPPMTEAEFVDCMRASGTLGGTAAIVGRHALDGPRPADHVCRDAKLGSAAEGILMDSVGNGLGRRNPDHNQEGKAATDSLKAQRHKPTTAPGSPRAKASAKARAAAKARKKRARDARRKNRN